MAEFLPGFEITSWGGICGPAGLPPAMVEKPCADQEGAGERDLKKTSSAGRRRLDEPADLAQWRHERLAPIEPGRCRRVNPPATDPRSRMKSDRSMTVRVGELKTHAVDDFFGAGADRIAERCIRPSREQTARRCEDRFATTALAQRLTAERRRRACCRRARRGGRRRCKERRSRSARFVHDRRRRPHAAR